MKKIRVLQVNKFYAPIMGGIEHITQEIAEGLNNKTFMDVDVLVCQKKGHVADENINGVKVHKSASFGVAFSCPVSISFFCDFKKMIGNKDIVHIHMPFPLADIALLLSNYKGKVIVWWHCDIIRQTKLLMLYRPFMRWLFKRADRIVVTSDGLKNNSSFLKSFLDKCVVIPYGVDTFHQKQSENYLNQKNKSSKKCGILFTGRLVYYKGCDILLKAFAQTKGATLTIAGGGPLLDELKGLAVQLGIDNKVEFLGEIDLEQLSDEYQKCDFFVLPSISRAEAFGLVQAEAMFYGKPIVNTELPTGVPEVSPAGETGLTVPVGNVSALAKAMQILIDDDLLREKYSYRAAAYARENYSLDLMLERVLALYKEILN